jgi:hypothetical protein
MKPEGGTLMKPAVFTLFVAALAPVSASADVLTVHSVAAGVWAIEGPAAQRDPENLGNNATFGLVETDAGAILIDPGGTWNGAATLDTMVRGLTDQPVTHVINTGGQDHRWLGNSYWQAIGATVIASDAAVEDQRTRGSLQMTMLSQLVGDGFSGTEPAYADVTFSEAYQLDLGSRHIEIHHPAPAIPLVIASCGFRRTASSSPATSYTSVASLASWSSPIARPGWRHSPQLKRLIPFT